MQVSIVGKNNVYFISTEFSELFKYDLEGVLVERKVLEEDDLTKASREAYFEKGQNMPANGLYRSQEIIIDAYHFNGQLYVLRKYLNNGNRDVELLVIPENDMKTIYKYYFESEENMGKDWLRSLCVGGPNSIMPNIYISE